MLIIVMIFVNKVHGHDRKGEIIDSIKQGSAKVVIHLGKITGYTCGLNFFNHSVGMTNDDLKVLLASVQLMMIIMVVPVF